MLRVDTTIACWGWGTDVTASARNRQLDADGRPTRWRPEDFAIPPRPSATILDYWHPGSVRSEPKEAPNGGAAEPIPIVSLGSTPSDKANEPSSSSGLSPRWAIHFSSDHSLDYWNPLSSKAPVSSPKATDHWYETADLPRFDPEARRAPWSADAFLRPFNRDARSKAKWVVAILQPTTVNDRAQWLRAFALVFLEHTSEKFFRKIRSIATQLNEPASLLGAIAIKDIWQERLDFQRRRARGARLGIFFTSGGTLSWPMALRIAAARSDYDTTDMVDPDWLDDWLGLRPSAEGYWFFAEYAVRRAEAEHFEDWDLVASLSHEERQWAGGRVTPIDDVSGISVRIRAGHPIAPAAVIKRYNDWQEKHGGCDSAVTSPNSDQYATKKSVSKPQMDRSLNGNLALPVGEVNCASADDNKLNDSNITAAMLLVEQDKRPNHGISTAAS